jgi:hypothetical protein
MERGRDVLDLGFRIVTPAEPEEEAVFVLPSFEDVEPRLQI